MELINETIEKLILYARFHLGLETNDVVFTRNLLLHLLSIKKPYTKEIDSKDIENMSSPEAILQELRNEKDDISDNDISFIMSLISPKPSDVIKKFNELYEDEGIDSAVLYLYNLSIHNNYLSLSRIDSNIEWNYEGEIADLTLSINMARPENMKYEYSNTSYPRCELCYSNIGYVDSIDGFSKSNLRVIPLKLSNEEWFFQFSPYGYYKGHAVLINKEHIPQYTNKKTVQTELLFLDAFSSFFIGANQDLSVNNKSGHMHFECGMDKLPIMNAKPRYILKRREIPDCEIEYLDWYTSAILLKSKNKQSILNISELIIERYKTYNDEKIDLLSEVDGTRYNSLSILSKKIDDTYYVYLIPRNNRSNEKYPNGIFNTRDENKNIKSEEIGLMESAGLFILPKRLNKEIDLISEVLSSTNYSVSDMISKNKELEKHISLINSLMFKYGRKNNIETIKELVKSEIAKISEKILKDTSVFKDTIDGQLALFRFLKSINIEVE